MSTLKLRVSVLFLACLCSPKLNGQSNFNFDVVPPAPNAAALGKYGDIPVSLYTGVPDLSIPIYDLSFRDHTLPISLSYHGSGVKVEEVASCVGVSWCLNAGGVITRSIRGLPDDKGYTGVHQHGNKLYEYVSGDKNSQQAKDYLFNVSHGTVDPEPDLYFFNFAGYSGRIVFDKSRQPIIIPYQELRIEGNVDEGFVITGADGIRYDFSAKEWTRTYYSGASDIDEEYVSSWYLTGIGYPDGTGVGFNYSNNAIQFNPVRTEVQYNSLTMDQRCVDLSGGTTVARSETQALRLETIVSPIVQVEFDYYNDRFDLVGDKSLDSIIIRSVVDGTIFRKYALSYAQTSRLWLNQVKEIGQGEEKPPYKFYYSDQQQVPSTLSCEQDHWGYYNGPSAQQTLVPTTRGMYVPDLSSVPKYTGANRNPSKFSTVGMLTKIVYPTGGYSDFIYEPHDYGYIGSLPMEAPVYKDTSISVVAAPLEIQTDIFTIGGGEQEIVIKYGFTRNSTDDTGIGFEAIVGLKKRLTGESVYLDLVHQDGQSHVIDLDVGEYELSIEASGENTSTAYIEYGFFSGYSKAVSGGGARIKMIKTFSADEGRREKVTYYRYKDFEDENRSSGIMGITPRYGSLFENEFLYTSGQPNSGVELVKCKYLVRKASSLLLGSSKGSHVAYKNVEVIYGESGSEGKERNEYTSMHDYPNFYPPSAEVDFDYKRGLLKSRVQYEKIEGGFMPVQVLRNYYDFKRENYRTALGIKLTLARSDAHGQQIYAVDSIRYTSGWSYVKKEVLETVSSEGSLSVVKYHFYDGGDHLQPTKTVMELSDGDVVTTLYTYPRDYSIQSPQGSAALTIDLMQELFLNSHVIETQQWKKHKGTETLVFAELNVYKTLSSLRVVKDTLFSYVGVAGSVFKPIALSFSGHLLHDRQYKPMLMYRKYSASANIIEINKWDVGTIGFLWGYKNALPIAQIDNASVDDVFYTSFEDEVSGVNEAKTGNKSHRGVYNIPLPSSAGKYRLSYWLKSTSEDWEYVESVLMLTSSSLISIGSSDDLIDEVRLFPVEAKMSTRAYRVGVGVSAISDYNGKISFYEYDGMGRLSIVKDQYGRIIQFREYNYKK